MRLFGFAALTLIACSSSNEQVAPTLDPTPADVTPVAPIVPWPVVPTAPPPLVVTPSTGECIKDLATGPELRVVDDYGTHLLCRYAPKSKAECWHWGRELQVADVPPEVARAAKGLRPLEPEINTHDDHVQLDKGGRVAMYIPNKRGSKHLELEGAVVGTWSLGPHDALYLVSKQKPRTLWTFSKDGGKRLATFVLEVDGKECRRPEWFGPMLMIIDSCGAAPSATLYDATTGKELGPVGGDAPLDPVGLQPVDTYWYGKGDALPLRDPKGREVVWLDPKSGVVVARTDLSPTFVGEPTTTEGGLYKDSGTIFIVQGPPNRHRMVAINSQTHAIERVIELQSCAP